MKRNLMVLLAGVGLAALAFGDNAANERFHMKTGRDLPWIETERAVPANGPVLKGAFLIVQGVKAVPHNDAEERFWMKTGRHTPAEEVRLAAIPRPGVEYRGFPPPTDAAERLHAKTGR